MNSKPAILTAPGSRSYPVPLLHSGRRSFQPGPCNKTNGAQGTASGRSTSGRAEEELYQCTKSHPRQCDCVGVTNTDDDDPQHHQNAVAAVRKSAIAAGIHSSMGYDSCDPCCERTVRNPFVGTSPRPSWSGSLPYDAREKMTSFPTCESRHRTKRRVHQQLFPSFLLSILHRSGRTIMAKRKPDVRQYSAWWNPGVCTSYVRTYPNAPIVSIGAMRVLVMSGERGVVRAVRLASSCMWTDKSSLFSSSFFSTT